MINILIVATQTQRFLDQVRLSKDLQIKDDKLEIYYFVSKEVTQRYKNEINNQKLKIINIDYNKKYDLEENISVKSRIKNILSLKYKSAIIKFINSFKSTKLFTKRLKKEEKLFLDRLNEKYKCISRLVHKNKIDIMFINGDRHLGYEPIFLKISKNFNIPTIMPYIVYFAEEEGLVKSSIIKNRKNILISSYIKKSQDKFNFHRRGNVFYYPHTIANALDKFGVITDNPWFMGSGLSDIICLANENMKKHYVKNGVKKEKIRIIGDVSYDKLYYKYMQKEDLKIYTIDKYKLQKDRKNIIIALPQLGEHAILPWHEHWKEINFLMDNIDNLEQNILVSLHPKMDKRKYLFLEDRYNCKILEERLADILIVSDVFIASYSSTILWSVICGIKTVIVDFYNINETSFDFLTSIMKVNNKKLLKEKLNDILVRKVDFNQDWESLSKNEVFDGKTIEKYINLIKELK
ncbi:MAG: hypothetical protein CL623_00360 [Arcobacter sp.]|nr:hypothetical protein [Arcobacter sp.]|tara:strand:+ start:13018 stop:14409 length:1392 start_codon:yes stop_codon:yes gene_type:complete